MSLRKRLIYSGNADNIRNLPYSFFSHNIRFQYTAKGLRYLPLRKGLSNTVCLTLLMMSLHLRFRPIEDMQAVKVYEDSMILQQWAMNLVHPVFDTHIFHLRLHTVCLRSCNTVFGLLRTTCSFPDCYSRNHHREIHYYFLRDNKPHH